MEKSACRHVGVTADIIASCALAHRRANMLSGRQAVQCTNFYTLQEIIIIATHVNMHRIAFFPDVSRHVYQKDKKFYCNELEN